jgi:hypothetical protein
MSYRVPPTCIYSSSYPTWAFPLSSLDILHPPVRKADCQLSKMVVLEDDAAYIIEADCPLSLFSLLVLDCLLDSITPFIESLKLLYRHFS